MDNVRCERHPDRNACGPRSMELYTESEVIRVLRNRLAVLLQQQHPRADHAVESSLQRMSLVSS